MFTAIFDLDGTLTKKDTYVPFLLLCIKEFGLRRFSVIFLPLYVLLYKCGIITNARLKEVFLSKILSGIPIEQLDPVAERFVSYLINKGLNRTVIQILNAHLGQKNRVILATASFDFYTQRFAERIGIGQIVCTRSELKNGILTGRILGSNCHGQEKVRRIEELLNPSDWGASLFYTDHYSDLPLLKKVGKGFIVNPSLKTRLVLRKFKFSQI
ncbi:MAG: HAD family hydrolase [Nitrospirota bacterium]